MSDWLIGLAGTAEGARLATVLALMSAVAHAAFGALQKGRHDPWLMRGSIDASLVVISAPVALFLVPWPTTTTFLILLGAVVVHFAYKTTVALAYERAAYTVVYPVIRGTGPVVTVLAASLLFQEHFTALQWVGVACLSGAMLLLALRNMAAEQVDLRGLKIGLIWAAAGGLMVAIYTVYDAYGIRQSPDPFTFLAWFFCSDSVGFPDFGSGSISPNRGAGWAGVIVAARLCWRADRLGQFWRCDAGHAAWQCRRGGGAARNINRVCRPHRLVHLR